MLDINFKRCILELTYRCNLRCRTCTIHRFNYKKDTLSFKKIQEIFRELKELNIKSITFLGGEPFLRKDILDISLSAKKYNFFTAVVTNGTLISRDHINAILDERIFDVMIFSLDGPKEIHNSIRNSPSAFEKLIGTISRIQRLKKKKKLKFPRIFLYSTLSSLNYTYAGEIFSLARKLDCQAIRFISASCLEKKVIKEAYQLLGSSGEIKHSYLIGKNFTIPKEGLFILNKVFRDLEKEAKAVGINLQIENYLKKRKGNLECTIIKHDLIISYNADVYICPMLPNYTLGNLETNSLIKILKQRDSLEKIKRLYFLVKNKKLNICKFCCVEKLYI